MRLTGCLVARQCTPRCTCGDVEVVAQKWPPHFVMRLHLICTVNFSSCLCVFINQTVTSISVAARHCGMAYHDRKPKALLEDKRNDSAKRESHFKLDVSRQRRKRERSPAGKSFQPQIWFSAIDPPIGLLQA